MNLKKIVIGVLVFPLGIYWLLRHMGLQNKWAAIGISTAITIAALILIPTEDSSQNNTAEASPALTATTEDSAPTIVTTGDSPEVADNERYVSRGDYGSDWPLSVDAGVLRCDPPSAVTFTTNGTTYWINGTAGGLADDNGWQDIKPIWTDDPEYAGIAEMKGTKINIGPLIDDGLPLCE